MSLIKKIIPKNVKRIRKLFVEKRHRKYSFRKKEEYINSKYKEVSGRNINWANPNSYTEKINVSKLYNYSEIKKELADKYTVRKWIANKIGDKYLIPLIGVYDKFDDIDFSKLPKKFVMKCNHDSGSVTICNNKENLNLKELRSDYNFYLKRNFADLNFEMHYKEIKPKILIEKNMGENINDYKFLCFDGKPYYCWVDVDRFHNHKRNVYDMKWELQPFNQSFYGNSVKKIEKPERFDEMIKLCEILSKDFDHVRIDLYDIKGKIFFGEMTFTNGDGMEMITPKEYDVELGKLWKNFKSNRNKYYK